MQVKVTNLKETIHQQSNMTKLSDLENKLITVLEVIAYLNSKSDGIEEKLNKFGSKIDEFATRFDEFGSKIDEFATRFDEFESTFDEFEVTFKKKMVDIDKKINQNVIRAVEEVTEKL